jgi:hypothetical protein
MNTVSFNQRLWRLPVVSSRRDFKRQTKPFGDESLQRQTNFLAGSLGLNNAFFDLSPRALWEAVGPKNDSPNQLQSAVIVCGDMIRDRINEQSLPSYIPFVVN